jgi:hypothetical protein
LGGPERGGAGVAEEVEQARARFELLRPFGDPFPVRSLLGEDAELLRVVHEPQLEAELAELGLPLLGAVALEFPTAFPAAFFVFGDRAGPFGGGQGFAPPGLGFAPDHADAADLLQLEAVAGIQEAVTIPVAHEYADFHGRIVGGRRPGGKPAFARLIIFRPSS